MSSIFRYRAAAGERSQRSPRRKFEKSGCQIEVVLGIANEMNWSGNKRPLMSYMLWFRTILVDKDGPSSSIDFEEHELKKVAWGFQQDGEEAYCPGIWENRAEVIKIFSWWDSGIRIRMAFISLAFTLVPADSRYCHWSWKL